MDNIKNFLGNVMTNTPSASTVVGPNSAKQVATTAIGGDRNEAAKYLQLKKVTNAGVGSGAGGSGVGVGSMVRTRTESESSVASDISGVSMSSTDSAGGRQIKRADSEPYFWIMWHS